jgi:hypothetical protein
VTLGVPSRQTGQSLPYIHRFAPKIYNRNVFIERTTFRVVVAEEILFCIPSGSGPHKAETFQHSSLNREPKCKYLFEKSLKLASPNFERLFVRKTSNNLFGSTRYFWYSYTPVILQFCVHLSCVYVNKLISIMERKEKLRTFIFESNFEFEFWIDITTATEIASI